MATEGAPAGAGNEAVGVTQLPMQDKAASAPDRFTQVAATWKEAGLDLEKMSPKAVAQALGQLQRLGQLDIPKLVEARARALAQAQAQQAPARTKGRGVELDEEDDPDDPRTVLKLLTEKLVRLEQERGAEKEQQSDLQMQEEIKQVWARDYIGLQESFPVLKDPEIDQAMRLVLAAHLVTTDSDDADKPGYVQRIGPQALMVLARAGKALSGALSQSGGLNSGGGGRRRNTDFGAMSDEEFEESLGEVLGR